MQCLTKICGVLSLLSLKKQKALFLSWKDSQKNTKASRVKMIGQLLFCLLERKNSLYPMEFQGV